MCCQGVGVFENPPPDLRGDAALVPPQGGAGRTFLPHVRPAAADAFMSSSAY